MQTIVEVQLNKDWVFSETEKCGKDAALDALMCHCLFFTCNSVTGMEC